MRSVQGPHRKLHRFFHRFVGKLKPGPFTDGGPRKCYSIVSISSDPAKEPWRD
jgi:hypothetical protein